MTRRTVFLVCFAVGTAICLASLPMSASPARCLVAILTVVLLSLLVAWAYEGVKGWIRDAEFRDWSGSLDEGDA